MGGVEPAEEPGPLDAETLREAWAAVRAGNDLTPEQEATYKKFARSRTWVAIWTGGAVGATGDEG